MSMIGSPFISSVGGAGLTAAQIIALAGQKPYKYDATTAPGVSNDINDSTNASDGVGFQVGSVWIDTTANEAYRCVDATDGAAVWINTTLTTDELGSMATQASDSVAITGGSVSGITDLAVADGGTGASDAATARANLGAMANPMTTAGDVIVGGTSGAPARLGVGTDGQVLTLASGTPTWADSAGGGGATAEEIADIRANKANVALLTLNQMLLTGSVLKQYESQASDLFVDTSGVSVSTNMTYNATLDSYRPTQPSTHDLLIQSETTDGSTTITDGSGNAHTITRTGGTGVVHEITDPVTAWDGSSALRFPGSSYLTVGASTTFGPAGSTGLFTAEMRIRLDNTTQSTALMGQMASNASAYVGLSWVLTFISGNLALSYTTDGVSTGAPTSLFGNVTSGMSADTWYHLAFVCDGTNAHLFRDGTRIATATQPNFFQGNNILWIGARGITGSPLTLTARVEEISVEQGVARYTQADETANIPTNPFVTTLPNVTFATNAITANSAPSQADAYILIQETSATENTDIIVGVRREGASSYATGTLVNTGFTFYDSNNDETYQIWRAEDIDLSGQTSGTAVQLQVTSANNVNFFFKGWLLQWV